MPGSNYNAPQYGVKLVLTRGSYRVTFNDSSDSDNVGSLFSIDGFDNPEVRESGEVLQERDGGVHSDRFFYGRRPLTLAGMIHGHTTIAGRNDKMQKLMDVTSAMRDDMTITWQPSGGVSVFTNVRRQQPLRFDGMGLNKTFTVQMVSADPRIYSSALHSVAAGVPVATTNAGSVDTPLMFTLNGPINAGAEIGVPGANMIKLASAFPGGSVLTLDGHNNTAVVETLAALRNNLYTNPSFESSSFFKNVDSANTTAGLTTTGTTPFHGAQMVVIAATGSSSSLNVTFFAGASSARWSLPTGVSRKLAVVYKGKRAASAVNANSVTVVNFYTSGGSLISSPSVTAGTYTGGAWSDMGGMVSVPDTAASFTVQVQIQGTILNGHAYYIDALVLEPSIPSINPTPTGAWFYPGVTTSAWWDGAADASTSRVVDVPGGAHNTVGQAFQYVFLGDDADPDGSLWLPLPPGTSNCGVTSGGSAYSGTMSWRDAWI